MVDEIAGGFGAQLRRLREAAGLTQEHLAERSGLTANAISALERGERRRPYPQTVQALVEALHLDAHQAATLAASVPSRGAASTVPTPRPQSYQLPVTTDLYGRERELAEIKAMLLRPDIRLVTLTGSDGVGKTSLAARLVDTVRDAFSDGAVFVELASQSDASMVIPTAARALGLREVAGQSLLQVLQAELHERHILIVLDNMEHLMDAVPDVVQFTRIAPGSTVLVTSRAPLRVRGEREYPVRPLEVPALARLPMVEDIEGNPAVELFVERARSVSPDFAISQQNAASITAICRRLDGLPLAIELAAARIRTLSSTALLARLDEALPLLADGARDLPERQRAMELTINWSYKLLDPVQQALFRRLAVFRGGWNLEAAEGIGGDEAVVGLLASLVEQSLVLVEPGEDRRYRLLEPVRQYAWICLEACGEAEETHRRHAAYYTDLATAALPQLKRADQVIWLSRLVAEDDNLRAAMEWLIEHRELDAAARLGYALWLFWWMRGHMTEGRRWMEIILDPPSDASTFARAWASLTSGVLQYGQGDYVRASAATTESVERFRELRDEIGGYTATGMVGLSAISLGDYERGSRLIDEAVQRSQAVGDIWNASMLRTYSAAIPLNRADYVNAAGLVEESLKFARQTGDRIGVSVALFRLAEVARLGGNETEAASRFSESLALSVEIGDRGNAAYCLEGLAGIAAGLDELARAARLWGAAESLLEGNDAAVYVHTPDRLLLAAEVERAKTRLNLDAWSAAWAEGRALILPQVIGEAEQFAAELAQRDTALARNRSTANRYPGGLSEREVEVLRLIAGGLTNIEVANRLFLSEHTIRSHLRRIYQKLDISTRAEAVRFVLEHHLG